MASSVPSPVKLIDQIIPKPKGALVSDSDASFYDSDNKVDP